VYPLGCGAIPKALRFLDNFDARYLQTIEPPIDINIRRSDTQDPPKRRV